MTRDERVWLAAGATATVGWLLIGWLVTSPAAALGAAAGAGTSAALTATRPPPSWSRPSSAAAALVGLPVLFAWSARGSTLGLVAAVGACAAAELGLSREVALLATAAFLAVATSAVVGYHANGSWQLGQGPLLASSLLVVATSLLLVGVVRSPSAGVFVLPACLVGFAAAPRAPAAVLVVAAAGAIVVLMPTRLVLPARWRAGSPASAGLAAAAVAAAAVPGGRPAGLLLAAAAVLLSGVPGHLLVALAAPGAAVLAGALVDRGPTATGWLAAAAVVVWGVAVVDTGGTRRINAAGWPCAALAGWLVVVPRTWTWAGAHGLGAYITGAATAVAVVSLLAVLGRARAVTSRVGA